MIEEKIRNENGTMGPNETEIRVRVENETIDERTSYH